MLGLFYLEFIELKYSSGNIFEAVFLLLDEKGSKICIYQWDVRYNIYQHDNRLWCVILNCMNKKSMHGSNKKLISEIG